MWPTGRALMPFFAAIMTCKRQAFMQRNLAALSQRSDRHRKRLTAGVTLVHPVAMRFALDQRGLVHNATVRAYRTMWPADRLEMLTGSFKAYARIIAEQLAFGIAAQAVFEAPPLPAIRMSQQIKTLSVWESPGYGSRLFVTNDGLTEAVADVPRPFVCNGKLCLQRGHNRFLDQFVAWPTAAAATPKRSKAKSP